MIQVTELYRKACEGEIRESYFSVKYGAFDKNAKSKINKVITTEQQQFSNLGQTYDDVKVHNYNYISCEKNRVKLDNTFAFIQDKNKPNQNQNVGYWNYIFSESNSNLNTTPFITYEFSDIINYKTLLLHFQEIMDSVDVLYYLNDNAVYGKSITNNNSLTIKVDIEQENVNYNKITIVFVKTKEPFRYVKFNEIDFGEYDNFENKDIKELDIIDEMDLYSDEFTSNSLTLKIQDRNGEYDLLNPYNKLKKLQEKQELTVYHHLKIGNKFKEIPLGTFLLKNYSSDQNNNLILECYDNTYFMNDIYYGSKFYENEECINIFKDIFNYFNFTNYILDEELEGIKLSGYIPPVEMREALRLVAEASQCVINTNRLGQLYIFKTYDPSIKTFKPREYDKIRPQNKMYNNAINMNVYNYSSISEESEIIYSGVLNKGEHLIMFNKTPIVYSMYKDNPDSMNANETAFNIIELYATGCKIIVHNNNTLVRIKAKYYIESMTSRKQYKDENAIKNVVDYTMPKVNNHLITLSNFKEVANWKLNRSEIKYIFDCNLTPYIEVGDTCKLMLNYKDLNGNVIKREFVPTYINFTKSLKQTIEGE